MTKTESNPGLRLGLWPRDGLYARKMTKSIAVYRSNGSRLGRIDHVMFDKISEKAVTAMVRVDGDLWFDSDRLSIPWSFLVFDSQLNGFVLGIGTPASRGAPGSGNRPRR